MFLNVLFPKMFCYIFHNPFSKLKQCCFLENIFWFSKKNVFTDSTNAFKNDFEKSFLVKSQPSMSACDKSASCHMLSGDCEDLKSAPTNDVWLKSQADKLHALSSISSKTALVIFNKYFIFFQIKIRPLKLEKTKLSVVYLADYFTIIKLLQIKIINTQLISLIHNNFLFDQIFYLFLYF